MLLLAGLALGACEDKKAPDVLTWRSDEISREVELENIQEPVLTPAIFHLLRLREELKTDKLDGSIRYLTHRFCTVGKQEFEDSWMSTVPIPDLYPEVPISTVRMISGCAQFLTNERTRLCGREAQARGRCVPSPAPEKE